MDLKAVFITISCILLGIIILMGIIGIIIGDMNGTNDSQSDDF